jgi:hypothetical protein
MQFGVPQLHQEVNANRLDFAWSEFARHFRELYAENWSLPVCLPLLAGNSRAPQISVSRVAVREEPASGDRKYSSAANGIVTRTDEGLIGVYLPTGLSPRLAIGLARPSEDRRVA